MEAHNSEQQEQHIEDMQNIQADSPPTQPALPYVEGQPGSPPQNPADEDEAASVTLWRVPTFNVHAFTSRSRLNAQQDTKSRSFLQKVGWPADQQQRLIDEETHLLPRAEINSASSRWKSIPSTWLEDLLVILFLGATLILQALSLFTYPAYSSDEGNYMANAWAVLQGKIAAYTFTYSHPPLGWMQIAGWTDLTGGITSFGNAINSGRVLMLVLATASSLLLYLIARRLSGSRIAAFLALVIYTLSPLSLLYRHEVLLDNIGTFWLLLSLYLITNGKSRLATLLLAAVALGIAILSKGVFLIFLPVMLYAVWLYATPFQRKFSLVAFLYLVLAIASLYALFALLKGELLPAGTLPGETTSHASLLAMLLQAFQAPGPQDSFRESWYTWVGFDLILLVAGTIALAINLLGGIINRSQLLVALFAATFYLFLLTSGVVYAFAILPLLPFLALNIALALNNMLRWLMRGKHLRLVHGLLLVSSIGILLAVGVQDARLDISQNQTQSQQEAMWWVSDHVPHNATVITNSYLYTDLHDPAAIGGTGESFTHAQIYSDAALDPTIAVGELKENWRTIDFLVIDSSMLRTITLDKRYTFLNQALNHAVLRADFGSSASGTLVEIYQVIHT